MTEGNKNYSMPQTRSLFHRSCWRILISSRMSLFAVSNVAILLLIVLSYSFLPNSEVPIAFQYQIHTSAPEIPSASFTEILSKVLPPRKDNRVDCAAIIGGNVVEIERAMRISKQLEVTEKGITEEMYVNLSRNCSHFVSERGYIMSPLSNEELHFPIAFSILIYTDMEMAERLLRAIYRPQNYYCIHVDTKSEQIYQAFMEIASCLPNVLLASRRLDMVWASFTVLEADLVCMETLWPFKRWKYFINLTGQEFPIKPNSDLVKILKALDGANDVHATLQETYVQRGRYRFHAPPTWFRPVKGSVHIAVSRGFVDYVLHNDTAAQILEWVRSLDFFHDETFFSTLNHNPQLGVPGSYKGHPEMDPFVKPFLSRYKVWNTTDDYFCYRDRWVRYICVLTTGDLPVMLRSIHLFANKFFLKEDRIAISCLEEWLYNSTRDNFLELRQMDVTYFRNLDMVRNQVRSQQQV